LIENDIMAEKEYCQEHSGHEARIKSLEESRIDMWKANGKTNERIDGMKNWVIAGMSSLLLQLIIVIITVALKVKGLI